MKRKPWLIAALLCGLILALAFLALYAWLLADLPALDDLSAYTAAPSSKVYDRHGRLLFEMPPPYTGNHTPVTLDDIPLALQQATLATEDATFYTNPGMDARGIARSLWINLQGGEVVAGGSTITQQVVRTLLFSPEEKAERTLHRKLRELVLAVRLTRRYSKDEILTLYFNETYYGNLAYGVEAAAQTYFGKPVSTLDLAEGSLLAGLPQAPALYNPLEALSDAKDRQKVVLDLMVKRGYLTAAEAQAAHAERLALAAAPFPIRAPHFVMYVRGILEQALGLPRLEAGGLHIYTTLDVDLNDLARDSARRQLDLLAHCYYQPECLPGGHHAENAAVVALSSQTGEVLAMVGSPDYFAAAIAGAVNGATALRQPGSALKPLVYAAAFDPTRAAPLTPATMRLDVQTAFVTREGMPYVPRNYDLAFRGPVRLREALASSYNVIAVKVLDEIGIETLTTLAGRMGITTFDDADPLGLAIALGGGEVRLLELTSAYAAFANGGQRVTPQVILRVEDSAGALVWAPPAAPPEQALDARVVYLLTDILSDDLARVATFGEESVLKLSRPAAVKTGTTTNFRDNWTVGYTPDLVVGVWVGNADNTPMRGISGVDGAAPIWHEVMETALKGRPAQAFSRPEGLVEAEVCAISGMVPGPDCPHRVRELFIAGTVPTETCTLHQRVGDQVYLALPPEAHGWAREQGIALPPTMTQMLSTTTPVLLTAPETGAIYQLDAGVAREAQRIPITAEADAAIQSVTLWLRQDEVIRPLANFTAPPYTVMWTLEAGDFEFYATGVDAVGQLWASQPARIQVHSP